MMSAEAAMLMAKVRHRLYTVAVSAAGAGAKARAAAVPSTSFEEGGCGGDRGGEGGVRGESQRRGEEGRVSEHAAARRQRQRRQGSSRVATADLGARLVFGRWSKGEPVMGLSGAAFFCLGKRRRFLAAFCLALELR